MVKTNICRFGHYSKNSLKEFEDYLSLVLKKLNFEVSISKNLDRDNINFIFEGHHGMYRKSTKRILNVSNKIKKGIILTEVIYGLKFLDKKYYTFNNRFLNQYRRNKIITFFYLVSLNVIFDFCNFFLKNKYYHLYQSLKVKRNSFFEIINYNFLKFFFNSFESPNGVFYWKERYNYFLSIEDKTDFTLNFSSSEENFFKDRFKNYFKLEFLSSGKKINLDESEIKPLDCLFTGQMTEYRSNIISKLRDANIKVDHYEYLDDKKRTELHRKSKIYLALNKNKDDNLPLGTRAWYCLENSFFFITEKTTVKNHLNDYCIQIGTEDFINKTKEILNNYSKYLKIMRNLLKKYHSKPFYNDPEVLKLKEYILRLI